MDLLRSYIRKTLIAEVAKGPSDLPSGYYVVVKSKNQKKIDLQIVDENDSAVAELRAHRIRSLGPCLSAYFVGWSYADGGWGPLLYDIAMEMATEMGSSLMPDRSEVSPEALAVWDFYLKNRSDVEVLQLDDLQNLLTDDEKDNCDQDAFDEKLWDDFPSLINQTKELRGKIRKNKFIDSSLTKAYRKKDRNVLNTLEKLKRVKHV